MKIDRTHWELFSCIVFMSFCHSASVGWTFPAVSIARDTSVWDPGVTLVHSSDQKVQANCPLLSPNFALCHGFPSTLTSTAFIGKGPPQAAPAILYAYPAAGAFVRLTRATTDFRCVFEIEVSIGMP